MQRITITLETALAQALDGHVAERGYASRSEAVRDLVRLGMAGAARDGATRGQVAATLSYVYDPETRDLSRRLSEIQHGRHDLTVATMRAHLDHRSCIEVMLLTGEADGVRALADAILAERGVRHGSLAMAPVEATRERHAHGDGSPHEHVHLRVRETF